MLFAASFKTGLVIPKDWKAHAKFEKVFSGVKLPEKFSWLEKLPGWTVKNQGQCGSCWAFAQTAILEAAIQLDKELPAPHSLSEQELVSCDTRSMGCRGGYFTDYQVQIGQTDEVNYPYVAKNTFCRKDVPHDVKAYEVAFVGDGNSSPTVEELKTAIMTKGPIAVTVGADSAFMNYRAGTVFGQNGCRQPGTNHMVVLTGWDDAKNAWQLRNSWGRNWGENGYMWIRYGCNRVAEQATFVVYKP